MDADAVLSAVHRNAAQTVGDVGGMLVHHKIRISEIHACLSRMQDNVRLLTDLIASLERRRQASSSPQEVTKQQED